MKKFVKWASVIIFLPILLIFLLAILLYVPPVQNWAVKQVASYASESTGMDISVQHVKLVFPLHLGVEGVKVLQPIDSLKNSSDLTLRNKKDTVADIQQMVVDVQLMPLFKSQVMVDELDFSKMKVNTTNFIHEARIKGNVGRLKLKAHGIDLGKEQVKVDHALLANAKLSVELSDTVPPDTTPNKNFWKINIQKLRMANTGLTLCMPGDTLQVGAYFGNALAKNTYLDLFKGLYQVEHIDWKQGKVTYDNFFEKPVSGMDFNHLSLVNMLVKADSFYYCNSKVDVRIKNAQFQEKSGLMVEQLAGRFVMDSTKIQLPDIYLRTPVSNMQATVDMDLNAFAEKNPGKLTLSLDGKIGRSDLMLFAADYLPYKMQRKWPYYPLSVKTSLTGNLSRMSLSALQLSLPTAFQVDANGMLADLRNIDLLKAQVRFRANTYHLGFATAMLDPALMRQFRIPSGIAWDGEFKMDGSKYATRLTMREGKGKLNLQAKVITRKNKRGDIDMSNLDYHAKIQAQNIMARHFLPKQDLVSFTGNLEAKGIGIDFLSSHTQLSAKAKVNHVHYGSYKINNILAVAHIANGKIHADVDSKNEYLTGLLSLDALTHMKKIQATMTADVRNADLYLLRLTEKPMNASLCGHVDLMSDLKSTHALMATMGDICLRTKDKIYRPVDVNLDLLTRPDTTHAVADCGDFHLNMDMQGGYEHVLKQVDYLQKELLSQLKRRHIDQVKIKERFPFGHIALTTGTNNFVSRFVEYCGYRFKSVNMDMNVSPIKGLNGFLNIDSLVAQNVQLDTIRTHIETVGDTIRYAARIENNKKNPQYVFRALLNGQLEERGSNIKAQIYDANDKLGVDVGLSALLQDNGIRISLIDPHPILGYKKFTANQDNYLMLSDDNRVSANLLLTASGGMGVRIYSEDENTDALQDITVSMSNFNLDKVLSVIPYMPDISGIMNGDFHIIQTKEELSVSSNLDVKDLVYEHCPMGDVGSEFVYMPKSDGSHYVDGILKYEDEEVATVKGTYKSEGEGYLDATAHVNDIPLHFINGFIPDQLVGLKGTGDGNLTIKGSLTKPQVDGELYLDSAYLESVPYGVVMRFANDPVRIEGSKLLFENFMMYANNESPLNIQGDLDFSNLDKMMLDIRMRAQNFLLIDAKENMRSEAYGKAYVNFYGMMRGPLSNLKMQGKLDVLGNTDMVYILRESELTTDNQLNELVKFTNFKSNTQPVVVRPVLEGFDMALSMSIDESAHILCALNADQSNYIDLMGGGDLQMRYNPMDQIQLTGKYTLNNGEMKYSLPVIPLKTFTIQDGSYIEFTGDPFNPTLSITATENIKSTVNEGQGNGRSVDFVCGVKLSQTLSKPGIQFIISAPSDMTLQDELNTMSVEERGKIAITMLASGMYLANGNTSSFSMNSALSSFLNSEINNIAGSAMRSMGLDVGMTVDNSMNAAGALHTDYNFKFAKRFFNNRLSFSVGGQVSTGAELENATNNNDVFFNNIELQYRLNEGASQYIRAFYNNNTYDWLEGQIGEYGVGFMWRRKLQHFMDIFRFKNVKQQVPGVPASSKNTSTQKGATNREEVGKLDSTANVHKKHVKEQYFDPLQEKK